MQIQQRDAGIAHVDDQRQYRPRGW
jgi:hypothetical protein